MASRSAERREPVTRGTGNMFADLGFPDAAERQAASAFFSKFPSNWSKGDTSAPALKDAEDVKAAWTSFCRALFASAEFRYLN